jgi:hypothetical protein
MLMGTVERGYDVYLTNVYKLMYKLQYSAKIEDHEGITDRYACPSI